LPTARRWSFAFAIGVIIVVLILLALSTEPVHETCTTTLEPRSIRVRGAFKPQSRHQQSIGLSGAAGILLIDLHTETDIKTAFKIDMTRRSALFVLLWCATL
jgi:hypothetical protein